MVLVLLFQVKLQCHIFQAPQDQHGKVLFFFCCCWGLFIFFTFKYMASGGIPTLYVYKKPSDDYIPGHEYLLEVSQAQIVQRAQSLRWLLSGRHVAAHFYSWSPWEKFQHKSVGRQSFIITGKRSCWYFPHFTSSNVIRVWRSWRPLPVCDGGFGALPLVVGDVLVEVGQTAGHGLCYMTQLTPGHSVTLQVVSQWALQAHKHIRDSEAGQESS